MKKVLLILLCLVCLCLAGREFPKYRPMIIPDYIMREMKDIVMVDTLIAGYWTIKVDDGILYPTIVGYKSKKGGWNNLELPYMPDVLLLSHGYFLRNPKAKYYEDKEVRVLLR